MTPKEEASQTAANWLALGEDAIILDTETTGLHDTAEAVEVAAVDMTGRPVFQTLVRPVHPIPPDVEAIHGITNEAVSTAPSWWDVQPLLAGILRGRLLLIYNAPYDLRILQQSATVAGCAPLSRRPLDAECVLACYAKWWGEEDKKKGGWKWQRLQVAAQRHGLPVPAAHRALSDCQTTLALIRFMAGEVAP